MTTTDGIQDNEWEHVKELAARLCDAVEGSEQEQASQRELMLYLDVLENKYGPPAEYSGTARLETRRAAHRTHMNRKSDRPQRG